MKKNTKILSIILTILLSIYATHLFFIQQYKNSVYEKEIAIISATEDVGYDMIELNNKRYIHVEKLDFPDNYSILEDFSDEFWFVDLSKKYFLYYDNTFPFDGYRKYCCFYDNSLDKYNNFVVANPHIHDSEYIYVNADMKIPNLNDTKIESIWFDWDSKKTNTDEDFINELVSCAKDENKQLSNQAIELINSNSDSRKDVWLKFEGYPIFAKYVMDANIVGGVTLHPTAWDFEGKYLLY